MRAYICGPQKLAQNFCSRSQPSAFSPGNIIQHLTFTFRTRKSKLTAEDAKDATGLVEKQYPLSTCHSKSNAQNDRCMDIVKLQIFAFRSGQVFFHSFD